MNLVIVESPTKARTISGFLGDEYKIESSYGHIRDLPKSKLGVDVEKNFEPHYIIPLKARKNVTALKKLAAKAEKIILATDEDREGEAIAWHLLQALGLDETKNVERIVFHEITKSAIEDALKNSRSVNEKLVNAQQARRILDRLVGYLLSPFLWKKIIRGLSAGRVQSVALRLIAEREQEIRNFKPDEYWSIAASLLKSKGQRAKSKEFEAILTEINGKKLEKFDIKTEAEADKITHDLKKCEYRILKIGKKEIKRNPPPPFTTSVLQQTASQRFRFSAKQTMRLAQNLYENGLITYHRTDSLNLSQESLTAAKNWIQKNLGEDYATAAPRVFKTKSRLAQEAHEAVRPTNVNLTTEKLKTENTQEKKLYELIWRRFIASQLPQAIFDATKIEIEAKNQKITNYYLLTSNGSILRFNGFLKIWPQKFEEKELPELSENELLELSEIKPKQHFTEPPPRYNEANLIKTLEEYGIGRPSTYAPIISVIQERNYVQKNPDRRFEPTEIGELVNKVLTEHFPEIVDIKFTAHMEEDLDEIAEGKKDWRKVAKEFYDPFSKRLEQKYEEVSKNDFVREEKTDEICEKCGKPMVIKTGRFGKFLACSGFPECKNTKSLGNNPFNNRRSFGGCEKCGQGEVVMKKTKKGRFFYGCNRYPKCDFATWKRPKEESKTTA